MQTTVKHIIGQITIGFQPTPAANCVMVAGNGRWFDMNPNALIENGVKM